LIGVFAAVDPALRHLPFVALPQVLGYSFAAAAPNEDEPDAIEEHDTDTGAIV
jgi:hypothetical protein